MIGESLECYQKRGFTTCVIEQGHPYTGPAGISVPKPEQGSL